LIRNGAPVKAKDGINIGNWHTLVKGLYVETLGLGGDSAIRYDKSGQLQLETMRVIPLSLAADKWPEIILKLQDLLNTREKHSLLLYEFFTLVKDIKNSSLYTEQEKQFCEALKNGPLIYTDAATAIEKDIYNFSVKRLEKEGIVMRCGLTPTDIMHLKGDFDKYSVVAAQLGAQFVANSTGMDVEKLCSMVYDRIKMKLYYNITSILLKENMPEFLKKGLGSELDSFINRSWELSQGENNGSLKFGFKTSSVLLGVGAPIHIFLPDVARALGTTCIIPKYAGVANAIGALAGNISATCTIEIRPQNEQYVIYGVTKNYTTSELEEATAIACEEAEKEAKAEALRRGATGNLVVDISVNPIVMQTGYGTDLFVESKIIATATGKIKI